MLTAFYKLLSGVCLVFGFKRLAIKLMIASVEKLDIQIPIIHMTNEGHAVPVRRNIPTGLGVVFEDKEALVELGDRYVADVRIPTSIVDVN